MSNIFNDNNVISSHIFIITTCVSASLDERIKWCLTRSRSVSVIVTPLETLNKGVNNLTAT